MPASAGCAETIKSAYNDQRVSLSITELGSSDDIDFLLGVGFKISVTHVGLPEVEVVELGNEGDSAETT